MTKSRKQSKERKNRAKKVRGVKKVSHPPSAAIVAQPPAAADRSPSLPLFLAPSLLSPAVTCLRRSCRSRCSFSLAVAHCFLQNKMGDGKKK